MNVARVIVCCTLCGFFLGKAVGVLASDQDLFMAWCYAALAWLFWIRLGLTIKEEPQ